jgi:hypothetical protein
MIAAIFLAEPRPTRNLQLVTLSWGTEIENWNHVAGNPGPVSRGALRRRRYIPKPGVAAQRRTLGPENQIPHTLKGLHKGCVFV